MLGVVASNCTWGQNYGKCYKLGVRKCRIFSVEVSRVDRKTTPKSVRLTKVPFCGPSIVTHLQTGVLEVTSSIKFDRRFCQAVNRDRVGGLSPLQGTCVPHLEVSRESRSRGLVGQSC